MLGAPRRLRCEYLHNPIGIDVAIPRLSWRVEDTRPAELQTAYHLLAASSPVQLHADVGDLWDTGRVPSSQTLNVEYRGAPLASAERVWWKVRSYDSDGLPSPWSEICCFEMGLLEAGDWQARWVQAGLPGSAATPVSVPLLRRAFALRERVSRARLYITAQGLYHAELNTTPVTEHVLTPPWTDYRKRVGYQTYDVTDLLRMGENVLGVLLADGWYAGHPGIGPRQQYGDVPRLLAQLDVTYASGASFTMATDESWRWQPSGLLHSDLMVGESNDPRQWTDAWSQPGAVLDEGQPVRARAREQTLAAMPYPALLVLGDVAPVGPPEIVREPLAPTTYLFDFGREVFGRAKVQIDAPAGVPIQMRYGSGRDPSGQLGQWHAGADHYTTCGREGECFQPLFVARGFRYLEIATELPPSALVSVLAQPIGLQEAGRGHFSCDLKAVNDQVDWLGERLQAAWHHVPMVGLAPRERIGNTAAGSALLGIGSPRFDVAGLYAKWLQDLMDAQQEDGSFPAVVPPLPGVPALQGAGGSGWCDAFMESAWGVYRHFGDRALLERCYGALRKHLMGMEQRFPDQIVSAPGHPLAGDAQFGRGDIEATARYYASARLAARVAGVLGRIADLEAFEEMGSRVRSAFRRRFVTLDGLIVGDGLGAQTQALHLGLFDPPERDAAFEQVVARLASYLAGDQVLPHVPHLLDVLAANGRLDLAYAWLIAMLERGKRDLVALGSVCEWLHRGAAGLNLETDLSDSHNAYRRLLLRPLPPLGFGPDGENEWIASVDTLDEPPIRWVSASLDTVNGRFESSWEITQDAFEVRLHVPANCSARVLMPGEQEQVVAAGLHVFSSPLVAPRDGIPILREVSEGA